MDNTDLLTNRMLLQDDIYVRYRKDSIHTDIILRPHSHNGYEIYYFQDGEVTYIVGDSVYALAPGDMLIFKGDILHSLKLLRTDVYIRSVINFTTKYTLTLLGNHELREMESLLDEPGGCLIRWSDTERVEVERLFHHMARENTTRGFGFRDMIRSHLTILLLRILRKLSVSGTHFVSLGQRELNVERVLSIINQRFRSPIMLDEIAREVHLSKHYLCHCFKEITGLTIHQYLAKRRVDESKRLLAETDKAVAVVAHEIGVPTVSQFSRLFKQHVGIPPFAYRKSYRDIKL